MFLTLSNRTFTPEHLDCRSQSSCPDNDPHAWFVAKPYKCPFSFHCGFHFGDYGVIRRVAALALLVLTSGLR